MVDLSIVFCMFTRGYPHHPHHPLLRRRRLQRSQASPTKSHLAGMVSSYKGPKNSNGRSERLSVSWRKKEQHINTVILDLIMVIYRQQVFEYMYMIVCIYIHYLHTDKHISISSKKDLIPRLAMLAWALARLQRFQGAGLRMVVKETRQRLRDLTPQAGQGRDANHRHVPLFHYGTMEVNGG